MSNNPKMPSREEVMAMANVTRQGMLMMSEMVEPLHEWLEGEIRHLEGMGFTPEQARAMAAGAYARIFTMMTGGG